MNSSNGSHRRRDHDYPAVPRGSDIYDGESGYFLYVPGRVLVVLDDDQDERVRDELLRRGGRREVLEDLGLVSYDGIDDVPDAVRTLREGTRGRGARLAPQHLLAMQSHIKWAPARPPKRADELTPLPDPESPVGRGVRVGVLDTGIGLQRRTGPSPMLADRAEFDSTDAEELDEPPSDGWLDPEAGHGTFISGLIAQGAPGATVVVRRLPDVLGCVDELEAARAIRSLVVEEKVDVLNLSFGGYTLDNEGALAVSAALEASYDANPALVVVAAAGNDGVSRPMYPAAHKRVIAVAALDGRELADFSNRGMWVDACTGGVDLHSSFVTWDGPLAPSPGTGGGPLPPEGFTGWALWSGTSFAAPRVAAAVAARISEGVDGSTAVFELVHRAGLPRVRGGGTVVAVA